ncbi:sensor histidine kinase [Dactylosporangium sp. CA-139066]|uniref:sensor histidine kinase n=1 Tax=Dactylosporangium sp. CA-139066 TaxID=3239930 RepID=UPI003D8D199C
MSGEHTGARRRAWTGAAVAVAGLAVATAVLEPLRGDLSLASVALLYLVPVAAAAAVGGLWPALGAAVGADALVNFFFVPPYHTLAVASTDNAIVLVVYVVVAAAVAVAMDVVARQRAAVARRDVESRLLAQLTAAPAAGDALAGILAQVRDAYRMDAVALVEHDRAVAAVGEVPGGDPALRMPAAAGVHLDAWGPPVQPEERRTLGRLAAAAARLHERQRLADDAARARELAEIDRLRTALLDAVSHDLRTPLAGIKAAASSLRQADVQWSEQDRDDLLATIEDATDRMTALVENLLSLSRLRAGVLSATPEPTALDAVAAEVVLHLPDREHNRGRVAVDVPDDLPLAHADPGLLERVVANLVANALAAAPRVRITGERAGDRVRLVVADNGPGVPPADRPGLFEPFQRRGDRGGTGLGLGLAIVRGFTEAMGGTVTPSETPGGGLTMTVELPAV